jgi:hypothetical protein
MNNNMKLYAETIDGTSYIANRKFIDHIYLHGILDDYKNNIADYVNIDNNDTLNLDHSGIQKVTVVYPDGTEHLAYLYYWTSPSKITWCKSFKDEYPVIEEGIRHGLVCDINDKEANLYAIKCFNEQVEYL